MSPPPKMAYLVSLYPAVSHTFILREVQLLRAMGHDIVTASINRAAEQALGAAERDEAATTYFVKQAGATGALGALLHWALRAPGRLLAMLAAAPRLGPQRRWWLGLAYALEALLVAQWMRREGAALLHVHFGNAAATVGLLVKQLTGCHLSYTIHGPDEFDDVPGQHLRAKIAGADAVICISQHARAQLMRIADPVHWPKLQVCRLGVVPDQFHFALRPPRELPRLLCVGRLAPAKGQVLLVRALAQLHRRGLPCALTLVGDGPDRARIEAEIARCGLQASVTLTGALPQAGVRAQMDAADVFVLPSLAEGIPVVLMEAMASGLPCVSTPVNGIPELISSEQVGLLARPGDVDALAEQLQTLIARPSLRASLAVAAQARLRRDFDLPRNVGRLSRLFRGFAPPPARPAAPAAVSTTSAQGAA